MKFDRPMMYIDMFDSENVTTNASITTTAVQQAEAEADKKIAEIGSQKAVKITLTF